MFLSSSKCSETNADHTSLIRSDQTPHANEDHVRSSKATKETLEEIVFSVFSTAVSSSLKLSNYYIFELGLIEL